MTNVLDESEEISSDLLRPILVSVRKENQVSPVFLIPNFISFILSSINWFACYYRKQVLFRGN